MTERRITTHQNGFGDPFLLALITHYQNYTTNN